MNTYLIIFTGFGANSAVYTSQELLIKTRHNWDKGDTEASNVLFLVQKEIKKHFNKYKIISIEKLER